MYIVPVVYRILMCYDSSTEENKDRTSSLLTTMDEPSPFAVAEFVGSVLCFCYFFSLVAVRYALFGEEERKRQTSESEIVTACEKKIL